MAGSDILCLSSLSLARVLLFGAVGLPQQTALGQSLLALQHLQRHFFYVLLPAIHLLK